MNLTDVTQLIERIDWVLLIERALFILVLIVVAWLIDLALTRAINHLFESLSKRLGEKKISPRLRTLGQLLNGIESFAVWVLAALIALDSMNINIAPILAAAGITGLALGFGAQRLIQDLISGFFILLEDQFRVGDVITCGGKTGTVEAVNIRLTRLRDFEGKVHFIPHSESGIITNHTHGFAHAVIEFGVDYREDLSRVTEVIRIVLEDLKNDPELGPDILETEFFGVSALADSAVVFLIRITTKEKRQWQIKRETLARLKVACDVAGINIPFPHRQIITEKPPAAEGAIDRDAFMRAYRREIDEMREIAKEELMQVVKEGPGQGD